MAYITVDAQKCKGCGLCVKACPQKIVRIGETVNQSGYSVAECFDNDRCTGCTFCALMCPDIAIEVDR